MPWQQFVEFVLYAGPGTAVFHRLHDGWDANTHKITDLIEWVKMSICAQAEDPERAYKSLGADTRPGQVKAEETPMMTIGEYMKLTGLEG